ncbi:MULTISPECIES: hypothetical protein [unclassified Microcoleus]|uniref:hypothetical protein n=1 Tax=unclassified Microcoleus TaxID=2642155 RepID=UPI002FCEA254
MSTIIYLRCGVQLELIDRPNQKTQVRSPATTKSSQRKEYHTAARSHLSFDRAAIARSPG